LPILPQNLSLATPSATSWNLAVALPWLSVPASNGVTPSSVTLNFNTTNLTAGLYTNQLTLSANGIVLQLPVTLQLFDLNASKMVADPNRNYIYVLHPGSGNSPDAFLLFLNTDTGIVEKVIPIGINPTDMTVNRFEDRLYVSNWQHNQTYVVNLASQTLLPPLHLGTDVYKINGGPLGRIVIEGEDQWVYASLVNTASGSNIGSIMVREGDGEYDPSGRYYYHVDNNDSGAAITRYDMTGDVYTSVASAGPHDYYGSRNLVMSLDGSRLFWTSAVYDSNLTDLGVIGAEIYACSTNGSIAFGSQQAFDTATKQAIYNLPVDSSVGIVDRMDQSFWYFDENTHGLKSLPIATICMPSIVQQPATNTPVGIGGNVYLNVTAMGLGPLSYQWSFAGTNLVGQTNYFLSLSDIQTEQQGNYQVVVSNPYGAVTSAVAQVTLLALPSVVRQPVSTNVLAGHNLWLSVSAMGSEPLGYQWYFQGTAIPDATSSSFEIMDAQAANDGVYSVFIYNDAGSTNSNLARIRVLPAKPAIVTNPSSLTMSAGSDAVFTVAATGSEPFGYQWFFNGRAIPNVTGAQLFLTNVQASNAGSYSAKVSNSTGSTVSKSAKLSVQPRAPYFVIQPASTFVFFGSTLTLSSQALGSQPIYYQWYFQGQPLRNQNRSQLILKNVTAAAAGNYRVVVTNRYGTASSSTVQVTVNVPPQPVRLLTNQIVKVGQNVTLAFAASGDQPISYSWQFNGAPISWTDPVLVLKNIQAAQAGYYQVTAKNDSGSYSSVAKISLSGPPSRLVAWGDNTGGQTNVPASLSNVVAAAAGDFHSIAVRTNGALVAWGDNSDGQTNIPAHLPAIVSIAAGASHNLAIGANGSLFAWGNNASGQCNIPASATNQPLAVSAGDAHSLALLANGTVIPWGDDTYGQIDLPDVLIPVYYWWWNWSWPNPNWVPAATIAAGRNHSLAVLTNGWVVAWGDDSAGQCDVPSDLTNGIAVAGGYLHSVALRNDGTIAAWGDNTYGQTNIPPGLTNVVAITAGDFNTLALLASGQVIGWGDNYYGQNNVPANIASAVGIASGYYHSLALISSVRPPAPVVLRAQMSSSGLQIHWQGGVLQWATSPAGPFADVPCQGNCFTNSDMSVPARFFRIRR
jgi:hypothetical protein